MVTLTTLQIGAVLCTFSFSMFRFGRSIIKPKEIHQKIFERDFHASDIISRWLNVPKGFKNFYPKGAKSATEEGTSAKINKGGKQNNQGNGQNGGKGGKNQNDVSLMWLTIVAIGLAPVVYAIVDSNGNRR